MLVVGDGRPAARAADLAAEGTADAGDADRVAVEAGEAGEAPAGVLRLGGGCGRFKERLHPVEEGLLERAVLAALLFEGVEAVVLREGELELELRDEVVLPRLLDGPGRFGGRLQRHVGFVSWEMKSMAHCAWCAGGTV